MQAIGGRGRTRLTVLVAVLFGLPAFQAFAGTGCPLADAEYRPIGLDAKDGWRAVFSAAAAVGPADLATDAHAFVVFGPFPGALLSLSARFFLTGGPPFLVGNAPAHFFDETLRQIAPRQDGRDAPAHLVVEGIDRLIAATTGGISAGLGAPIWKMTHCRARLERTMRIEWGDDLAGTVRTLVFTNQLACYLEPCADIVVADGEGGVYAADRIFTAGQAAAETESTVLNRMRRCKAKVEGTFRLGRVSGDKKLFDLVVTRLIDGDGVACP